MRVLLAGPDYEENLSIRHLSAALLNSGHETDLATFNSSADIGSVTELARHTNIVGLSMCFQSRAREFLHLARLIKAEDPTKLLRAGTMPHVPLPSFSRIIQKSTSSRFMKRSESSLKLQRPACRFSSLFWPLAVLGIACSAW